MSGTDKMSAGIPVGEVRTCAYLGGEDFTFANWAGAVRAGHTFTTTGLLIDLSIEAHAPGEGIRLPDGGGTLEVESWVESVQPFHGLQIVVNGQGVARKATKEGTLETRACTKVRRGGSQLFRER